MSFMNIESPMFVVHFYGLVCFICLQFYGVWSLQFNGNELLSWWWNGFVVAIELVLEWRM
jgi:hypothetical protein